MSRRPGYETNDYVGYDREVRRETMTQRSDGGIGRPRGAAARVAGREPDAATLAARTELAVSELDYLRMQTRMRELTAP